MVSSGLRILAVVLAAAHAARHDVARGAVRVRELAKDQAQEALKVVPKPVSDALKGAMKNMKDQLKALQAAEADAEQKKAHADETARQKMALMEAEKNKTVEHQDVSEQQRLKMLEVEEATAKHLTNRGDLNDALVKWNEAAAAVEEQQRKVTAKEEAIAQVLSQMKADLEAKKDELDAMIKERDANEQDMMDKKGQAMAATQVKEGKAKEAADAEKAVQEAQKELRDLQAELDKMVSRAAKAEAQSKEASGTARDAKNAHEDGKRTMELLKKLQQSINTFYRAVDDIDPDHDDLSDKGDEPFDRIKFDPKLKTAFEKYNLMVTAFTELNTYAPDKFAQVQPAISEIDKNAMAAIELKCDPYEELGVKTPELEAKCGSGLWEAVGISRQNFPA